MSRRQDRERPPAAHERDITLHDPEDLAAGPVERLVSARFILTRYVRAVDLLEAYDASTQQRVTNPLKLPNAPHAVWARQFKEPDPTVPEWDQSELDDAERLVGGDSLGQVDVRSGHTRRATRKRWPPHVTYGSEEWYQLRWRPFWLLDRGQTWMDRFELGERWWQAIYDRFPMERSFDRWRKNLNTGHRGVIWSAPTSDGRLEEPALAVVVVSSTRRPRRTARWPLFMPNPDWPPEIQTQYVDRRHAGEPDWRSLSARLDTLAKGGVADIQSLAQRSLRARIEARRKRRR